MEETEEELLGKYLDGKASPEQCAIVESWYLEASHDGEEPTDLQADTAERKVWERLSVNQERERSPTFPLGRIAAILILTFCCAYLYFHSTKQKTATLNTSKISQRILPGSNKAVLILANGQKLELTDANTGKIATQTGVKITKTAKGQLVYTALNTPENAANGKVKETEFNTIQTPAGGQYQVNLPDGTRAWLNASSSLKFPIRFGAKERRVELTGEGYFEVAKNTLKPFKVKTDKQEIMVFGTHFNVNAYSDELKTRTTLLEGSVKVMSDDQHFLVLKPGEQAVLGGKQMQRISVDVAAAIDWKNELFVFNNEKIETIMRRISRWYDVDIVYKGKVSEEKFMGTISRYQDIKEVLNLLELTNLVHFKIEERRIIVMP